MISIRGENSECQYEFRIGFTRHGGQDPYFSITGTTWELGRTRTSRHEISSGALSIGKYEPRLAHLDKWHLCSVKEPMHYVANSMYHASDKDCWGKRKGEPWRFETSIYFNDVPIPFKVGNERFIKWLQMQDIGSLEIRAIHHREDLSYKWPVYYTFAGYCLDWHKCPFHNLDEAENFLRALRECKVEYRVQCTAWGEGKEPDLEAARASAVWPEAALGDFTEEKLLARLPGLMRQFRAEVEAAGVPWPEGY